MRTDVDNEKECFKANGNVAVSGAGAKLAHRY